jgi:hypothetical protein
MSLFFGHIQQGTNIMLSATAWYDASVSSSLVLDGSNRVQVWEDLSPNEYHVIQTGSTIRPLYESGSNRVNFRRSNSERLLNYQNPVLSQPLTTVQVFEAKVNNLNQIVLYGAGTRQCGTWLTNSSNFYLQGATNSSLLKDEGGQYPYVANKKYIIIYKWNGASTRAYINGIGAYGSGGANGMVGLRVGYGGFGDYADGYLYEAAVFNWFLSSIEEREVTNYLQSKWSVTLP